MINAIYNARKHGFNNIIKKSYFKLAACFIVLGDCEKSLYYLEKIKNDPYFSESPRNQLMYHDLMKGYYHLTNYNFYLQVECISDYCNIYKTVEFNCFDNENNNKFFIETRMW